MEAKIADGRVHFMRRGDFLRAEANAPVQSCGRRQGATASRRRNALLQKRQSRHTTRFPVTRDVARLLYPFKVWSPSRLVSVAVGSLPACQWHVCAEWHTLLRWSPFAKSAIPPLLKLMHSSVNFASRTKYSWCKKKRI